jgi:hypothetical protein
MSSKYGFLCFLALALILLLVIKNYEIWTQPVKWIPEESTGKKSIPKPEDRSEGLSTGPRKASTSMRSYASIAEKNIFSPDRKDFPTPVGAGGRQLVRPQIVLYGVTIIGDYKAASLSNPGRPLQKGERETFTVKVGERVGEYKLSKILSDRVTLEAEGDIFEVLLYDQSKSKRRSDIRTETKPATITSTQPVSSPPVPGSPTPTSMPTPVPTPSAPSTIVPRAGLPAATGQAGVAVPQPAGPITPALPQTGFPRRRPYYPPSVPSGKAEGN